MRSRWLGIIPLLLLAPITAELLQAYLGDLGGTSAAGAAGSRPSLPGAPGRSLWRGRFRDDGDARLRAAPLPQETTWAEEITQNCTYLGLVLLLGWALHRRTRPRMDR
ncbi:hypothetical protein [Nocardioides sp. AE5]|uniref:hypothetical protein n=1 Tax=Nocardioides sp. AE5 TaxID=2962573 RepID=UPI002881340D|nr:hypothetical protein [Nocardioides sp. AE5]MDT0202461.1 hypothetical protein [Nocardioides sp. AE5]